MKQHTSPQPTLTRIICRQCGQFLAWADTDGIVLDDEGRVNQTVELICRRCESRQTWRPCPDHTT